MKRHYNLSRERIFQPLSRKIEIRQLVQERFFAHPVPHKGLKDKYDRVDEYPVKVLVKDLNSLGF